MVPLAPATSARAHCRGIGQSPADAKESACIAMRCVPADGGGLGQLVGTDKFRSRPHLRMVGQAPATIRVAPIWRTAPGSALPGSPARG